jgi:hypothetical protein
MLTHAPFRKYPTAPQFRQSRRSSPSVGGGGAGVYCLHGGSPHPEEGARKGSGTACPGAEAGAEAEAEAPRTSSPTPLPPSPPPPPPPCPSPPPSPPPSLSPSFFPNIQCIRSSMFEGPLQGLLVRRALHQRSNATWLRIIANI